MARWASRQRIAALLTVAIAVVIGAGLVVLTGRSPGSSSGAARPSVAPGPAGVGAAAPAFSATAVDGTPVSLGALRGDVVLVNFFATWCVNCKEELPLLQSLHAALQQRGVHVIGVDFRDTGDPVAMLRQYGVTYPAVLDPDSTIGAAYGINDLPVSVFIDRQGRVAQVFHGQLSAPTLDSALKGVP